MTLVYPGRMQRFCEGVRRYNPSYAWVRYASGSRASFLQSHVAQQHLNKPSPTASQKCHGVKLHIQPQRVTTIDGKGHRHRQSLFPIVDFESEISKPDDHIDLSKAAALLALHADVRVDAVHFVTMELSRLKTGFYRHAVENVPLAAPLPPSCRQQALAAALCDFLKADDFEGCSPANYYRAESSMLPSVLASKRGNPISLALLYREVGHAGGLRLKSVNFPRHSLLRFGSAEHTGLLEPFSNHVLSSSEVQTFIGEKFFTKAASCKVNWGGLQLSNVAFLGQMAANLQHVYQRHDNTELAARLAPYIDLLDERTSMHRENVKRAEVVSHKVEQADAVSHKVKRAHVTSHILSMNYLPSQDNVRR